MIKIYLFPWLCALKIFDFYNGGKVERDKILFGCCASQGKINQKSNGTCVYNVRSFKELSIIIDHFDKYPLLTQKQADYLLFKSAFLIIKTKEHLTQEGFHKY